MIMVSNEQQTWGLARSIRNTLSLQVSRKISVVLNAN